MASFKIVVAEAEGTDAVIIAALQNALQAFRPQPIQIPTEIPAAFPATTDEPHPTDCKCGNCLSPLALPPVQHRGRSRKISTPQVNSSESNGHQYQSAGDVILAALKKRPMSAQELIAYTKLAPGNVYGATSTLKKAGTIETRIDDDGDGLRRWVIV